jgi:hypothetical protein
MNIVNRMRNILKRIVTKHIKEETTALNRVRTPPPYSIYLLLAVPLRFAFPAVALAFAVPVESTSLAVFAFVGFSAT